MATYTGRDGSITFDGDTQTKVKNWSLEASMAVLDATELGDDTVNNVAGLKSYSGSATIMYHDDNQRLARMLDNLIRKGVPSEANVRFDWGSKGIAFTAFITNATITCSVGEIMTAAVTFTNKGDVLFTSL